MTGKTPPPLDEATCAAHDAAQDRGEAGYTDPATGYFVFTRATQLERGYCCGNGCRHCPYPEEEPMEEEPMEEEPMEEEQ